MATTELSPLIHYPRLQSTTATAAVYPYQEFAAPSFSWQHSSTSWSSPSSSQSSLSPDNTVPPPTNEHLTYSSPFHNINQLNGVGISAEIASPQHQTRIIDPECRTYQLSVIQHPVRTAEFGNVGMSRVPLSPPVIVQLTIRDHAGHTVTPDEDSGVFVAHVSLHSEDGTTALDMGSSPGGNGSPPRRMLYGNLVATLQKYRDLQNRMGLYFIFSDVGVRWRGTYQLGITLLRLGFPSNVGMPRQPSILARVQTRPFDVLASHQYTAPAQTPMTMHLLRQGALIVSAPTTNFQD